MWTDSSLTSSRRKFLGTFGSGIAGIALADLFLKEGVLGRARAKTMPSYRALRPRAQRVIHVFLQGGLSHVDSWDYKPELARHHGKEMPEEAKPDVFGKKVGLLLKPVWEFKRHGQCGHWGSALFPHLCRHMDDLAFVHSMHCSTGNHTPATYQANCGFTELGFPSLGAWLSYGLGSENRDLPGFVVLGDPRGFPAGGPSLWGNGFLSARHQGIVFQSSGDPIANLNPATPVSPETHNDRLELLRKINSRHLGSRGNPDYLDARIKSYELSARMQLAVPEAVNLDGESDSIKSLYGVNQPETAQFARMCLLARRLIERDVRFVQLWSGATLAQPTWDSHGNIAKDHLREAIRIDKPLSGLLSDLKQRGLLEETLVIFSTEFGRTPFTEIEKGKLGTGRDHNQTGFTNWFAGGGVKGGSRYGSTDPLGFKAAENPVSIHDFHATILHLLGINHEELVFHHNGFDRRLTNVHGEVLHSILG